MQPTTIPIARRSLRSQTVAFLLVSSAAAATTGSAFAQRSMPREEATSAAAPARLVAPLAMASGARQFLAEHVLYDSPGDGSLWASCASYKTSFDAQGATYYPVFGKRAPHDMPHALSPESASIGGKPLAFDRTATATRDGDRVAIDRGAFVETYDLAPGAVEQSFTFTSLPNQGDLVLRIPVASELPGSETADGIEFRGEPGAVSYGRAVAIDARGSRRELSTCLQDGAIVIRADASVIAGAELPLVIDPVVTTVFVGVNTDDDFQPDAAFDPVGQVWLLTHELAVSATDDDVYAEVRLANGTLVSYFIIDVTSDSWVSARCADCAAAHDFLVVAENIHGTTHTIRGRTATPLGTTLTVGPQFGISDSTSGDKTAPSVGGDPFLSLPSNFCVAYVQAIGSSDSEIAVCMVSATGTPAVPTFLAHVANQADASPSVSKSDDTYAWTLAWRRNNGILFGDIWAAHVHYDGFLLDGPFGVTSGGPLNDFQPCASSPQHLTQPATRSAIAFVSNFGVSANREIHVAVLEGTTVLQIDDLGALEPNGNPSLDQIEPAIDCDGNHFLVSYSEQDATSGNYNVFATDLYLADNQLGVSESHIALDPLAHSQRNSRISAAHDVNSSSRRFCCVYDMQETATDRDVLGTFFDAVDGGAIHTFCAGTVATCPCGNSGNGLAGCANSVNANGAALSGSGQPSTLSDTVSLAVSGMPPSTTCLFFQGTTAGTPTAFGDGLRCASGTIVRLATKTASTAGIAFYPTGADSPVSVRGMVPLDGGTRAYQVWYRNAAAFCTSATFNLSNGVSIDWAR